MHSTGRGETFILQILGGGGGGKGGGRGGGEDRKYEPPFGEIPREKVCHLCMYSMYVCGNKTVKG